VTPPTDGISRRLAAERASNISSVRYDLTLAIPESFQEYVRGREIIGLQLAEASPLILDFAPPAGKVLSVKANGQMVPVRSEHGHLIIPGESVKQGNNTIEMAFTAGQDALNRHEEYLYSLFVPARASHTFPCFDQPDMKASLSLALEIPSGWAAVSNGAEIDRETSGTRAIVRFAPTPVLPTYLFGFAAGRFAIEHGERHGRLFHLYHRETDGEKVTANREAILDLHQQAIEWLEAYTARAYPFEKLDFVLLPAFQFSGMEHAGAIFYNAPSMLLDGTATQEQQLARASTIAHETAHMWFGDLVTMTWFDDVWLKEVFANFLAAKIVNPSFPEIDHELRFLLQHFPLAYAVDRTAAPNPIRQTLENLNDAGSMYGPIIYDKAPIVMRQLEEILGADQLRDGLREYLTRYAFANATWPDLIQILDQRTDEDLAAWSHVWVDEPGRPTLTTDLTAENGTITSLTVTQADPRGRSLLWDQRLRVALGYEHGARISPLRMSSRVAELADVRGQPAPRYVLPNGEGSGYGLFKLDTASKTFLLAHLPEIGDGLTRGTAWITLWDDMLEGGTLPGQIVELALESLPHEREEQNVQRILSYLGEAYWTFLSDPDRRAAAARVEQALRAGIRNSAGTSLKSAYFGAFRRMATTADGLAYLERVWRQQEMIPDLIFAEADYIAMAQELALRNAVGTDSLLARQARRIADPDRTARFTFVMPALSSTEATRDAFFASLTSAKNREREPWVVEALTFLNHPLRRRHAERYIEPSLGLLEEIQRTGDIFFPMRWTRAVLDGHNSPHAAQMVAAFLAGQNDYPPRLRQIVEQSADPLFRAARIVN
jgi:aminopeptidase N